MFIIENLNILVEQQLFGIAETKYVGTIDDCCQGVATYQALIE